MGINLTLAWRNLWRHPRRTGLTLAAIVFSDVLLVWMIALQLGQYDMMIDNTLQSFTGHVQIQAHGYLDNPQMRRTVPDAIELAAHIRQELHNTNSHTEAKINAHVSARAMGFALVSSEKRSYGAQIAGVQPQYEPQVSVIPGLIQQGRYLSGPDREEAVIGSVMARNLKAGIGDELTLLGSGKDGSFAAAVVPIVGIYESGNTELDRQLVQLPLRYFQDVFSMRGSAHSIVVTATSHEQTQNLTARLRNLIHDDNLDVVNWERLQPGLKQAIQADFSTAWLMYGVLVALVAFSVLNTFLMSVLERTREFGIMLALGVTPGKVGRLVWTESFFMAVTGMLFGIAAGAAFTTYFVIHGFSYPGMEELASKFNLPDRFYPALNSVSLLLGPGVIFIATLLAALWPATRIHLLKPVEAMQAV
ncbi:MAG: FtsX-like permease family protein [Gammaproteobacteria bacterium]|nr:FtsX-like permease family protein [Gammaproteobacteria bacterium]